MNKEYHFKNIESTSIYLKKNYTKYGDLTFVSADYQTKGHGRYNRKWISKEGENLLFSLLLKDKKLIKKYASLSIASAVCIYQLLYDLNIKDVSIKWPNDVYVKDNKISGILLESVSRGNEIEALIIGIGLNVNASDFDISATSMFLETNKKYDINEIKNKLYLNIKLMLDKIINNDNSYLDIARNNNYLKGKILSVKIDNQDAIVEVLDINNDNSLLLKEGKNTISLYSGEITFHK